MQKLKFSTVNNVEFSPPISEKCKRYKANVIHLKFMACFSFFCILILHRDFKIDLYMFYFICYAKTILGSKKSAVVLSLVYRQKVMYLKNDLTNLTTEVKDLLGYFKKLEADLAVTKNVNSKLMERVVQTHAETLLKLLVHLRLSEIRIWKTKCAIFLEK